MCRGTVSKRIGRMAKLTWFRVRNDPTWLFCFAMHIDYRHASDRRAMYHISHGLSVQSATQLRAALYAVTKLATFFMTASNATYKRVENQLAIGPYTVVGIVRNVSRAACHQYGN